MLVVGATLLQAYWTRSPQAEPALRALHALMSRASPEELALLLAGAERDGAGGAAVPLPGLTVQLRINDATGLIKIESVEADDDAA